MACGADASCRRLGRLSYEREQQSYRLRRKIAGLAGAQFAPFAATILCRGVQYEFPTRCVAIGYHECHLVEVCVQQEQEMWQSFLRWPRCRPINASIEQEGEAARIRKSPILLGLFDALRRQPHDIRDAIDYRLAGQELGAPKRRVLPTQRSQEFHEFDQAVRPDV